MAFMRAAISNEPETWIITENDDDEIFTCLPDGDYFTLDEVDFRQIADDNNLDIDEVREAYNEALRLANNHDFTIRTGFRGWLAAPGYLDRTSVVVADSVAEVARELLDLYFDRSLEYMDDDELEDAEWLSDLCDWQSQVEELQAEIDKRETGDIQEELDGRI
jgi:hypothetical protein